MTDASSLSGIIAGMLTLSPVWAGAGHAGVCGRAADSLLLASASPALAPVTLTIPWLGPALAPATSLAIDAIVP